MCAWQPDRFSGPRYLGNQLASRITAECGQGQVTAKALVAAPLLRQFSRATQICSRAHIIKDIARDYQDRITASVVIGLDFYHCTERTGLQM